MQFDKRLPDVLAQLIDTRSVTPVRVVYARKRDIVIPTSRCAHEHMRRIQRVDKVGRHGRGLFATRNLGDGVGIRNVHRLQSGQDLDIRKGRVNQSCSNDYG